MNSDPINETSIIYFNARKKRTIYCPHQLTKYECSICNPKPKSKKTETRFCPHSRIRNICIPCKKEGTGGKYICHHLKQKTRCQQCQVDPLPPLDACAHSFQSPLGSSDSASELQGSPDTSVIVAETAKRNKTANCDHGKMRTKCVACYLTGIGGEYVCPHLKYKYNCTECIITNPTKQYHKCEHNQVLMAQKNERDHNICPHNAKFYDCRKCKIEAMQAGDVNWKSRFCQHLKAKYTCRVCKVAKYVNEMDKLIFNPV
jgi:hypothetical protein